MMPTKTQSMHLFALLSLLGGCSAPATNVAPDGDEGLYDSQLEPKADEPLEPEAVHGMLMVGSDTVYLSHLPMFHQPHNYQVIVEAELLPDDSGVSPRLAYAEDRQTTGELVYTLVPEPFRLPSIRGTADHPFEFTADIYRGHFERGGKVIARDVQVRVSKVIHFRKFNPEARRPLEPSYLLFGRGADSFLAHLITVRPDFDQVLAAHVSPSDPVLTSAVLARGATLRVLGQPATTPLMELRPIKTRLRGISAPLKVDVDVQHYLEHGDLL